MGEGDWTGLELGSCWCPCRGIPRPNPFKYGNNNNWRKTIPRQGSKCSAWATKHFPEVFTWTKSWVRYSCGQKGAMTTKDTEGTGRAKRSPLRPCHLSSAPCLNFSPCSLPLESDPLCLPTPYIPLDSRLVMHAGGSEQPTAEQNRASPSAGDSTARLLP